ncbi:hypothetical protein XF_2163 [Xylella fastidiosa 9a5c]|uniref:Uncharacterized protein n=1 Tax=Xylella fastidiosa (strain 9a5c) TaxID=160492 RepID=Q9PBI1_XYLFA|nr:hypothetical protein XF_2163 [Xylella fastidiosa 9a5c]
MIFGVNEVVSFELTAPFIFYDKFLILLILF